MTTFFLSYYPWTKNDLELPTFCAVHAAQFRAWNEQHPGGPSWTERPGPIAGPCQATNYKAMADACE